MQTQSDKVTKLEEVETGNTKVHFRKYIVVVLYHGKPSIILFRILNLSVCFK